MPDLGLVTESESPRGTQRGDVNLVSGYLITYRRHTSNNYADRSLWTALRGAGGTQSDRQNSDVSDLLIALITAHNHVVGGYEGNLVLSHRHERQTQ